jgi:hypothetical protein
LFERLDHKSVDLGLTFKLSLEILIELGPEQALLLLQVGYFFFDV